MIIDTKAWGEFRVDSLFDIHPTKTYKDSEGKTLINSALFEENGINPVIVNSSKNNGIGGYTNRPCNETGGIITFSDTTSSEAVFYQDQDFVGYAHVQGMYPKKYMEHWNKYTLKFFEIVFKNRAKALGYDYVNKFTREYANNIKVFLPIVLDGSPDWSLMESTIKDYEKLSINRLNLLKIIDKNERTTINIENWKRFHLYDDLLFTIDSGSKLDRIKMTFENPKIAFVGRSSVNNGITERVDFIVGEKLYKKGYLTIALGGEHLGSCFVQNEPFYTSQNVCVLIPNNDMSIYVKKFISTIIYRESRLKYKAFIDELNRHIRTDFTIPLPIDSYGVPNWDYMNKYMKDMELFAKSKIASLMSI